LAPFGGLVVAHVRMLPDVHHQQRLEPRWHAVLAEGDPVVRWLAPSTMLDAPFAGGYFTGDYEGLASDGASFLPVVVRDACGTTLTCQGAHQVTVPADRIPTNNDSTDLFVGTGF